MGFCTARMQLQAVLGNNAGPAAASSMDINHFFLNGGAVPQHSPGSRGATGVQGRQPFSLPRSGYTTSVRPRLRRSLFSMASISDPDVFFKNFSPILETPPYSRLR